MISKSNGVTVDAGVVDRRIDMPWKQITSDVCDRICKALIDRDTEVPIRVVDLMDNQLGPQQTQKITSCLESSPVSEVLIGYNEIGKEGCDGLSGVVNVSSKLEKLDIRGNHLTCSDIRKLLKSLSTSTTVTHLCVASNKLGPEGALLVSKAFAKNTYLTFLDLSMNEIGPSGAESIAKLLTNPASTLKSVHLYGNYLGPAGMNHICQAMKTNREVKCLTIGNNNATDESAAAIAEMLEANYTLEELDIRLNTFTATGVREIAKKGLEKNTSLTSLCLSGNPLGPVGGDELAKSLIVHQRSSLSQLDLSSCGLGPTGGMRIANLLGSSICLKDVNLSDNLLDDEAAIALARNISTSISVSVLDLSCNSIGEVGASNLIDATQMNTHLSSMVLHGNDINRVVQKKIDNLLEERLAKNRVQNLSTALQQQQRMNRQSALPV